MRDAAYYAERYRWHKEHGYCVYCRKNKARKGKVACQECADKFAERKQKRQMLISNEEKERMRHYNQKLYYQHREKGLCVHCSKPAIKGEALCLEHKLKDKAYYRKSAAQKPIRERKDGFCFRHPDKPTVNGSKMCADCYEKACMSLAKARQKSHFRKLNTVIFRDGNRKR